MNAVLGALLPLIVTLALAFFAAWHHDFTPSQATRSRPSSSKT